MARSRHPYTASAGLLGVLALGALLSLGACTKLGPTVPEEDEDKGPNDPTNTGLRSWAAQTRYADATGSGPPLILL